MTAKILYERCLVAANSIQLISQQVAVWKTVIMILQKTPLKMFNATPSEKLLSN